jgi:hypothetical protein
MALRSLQQRLAVVSEFRSSNRTQSAFCRDYPDGKLSPRTLRSWLTALKRPEEALARQHAVVADALERWTSIQAAMQEVASATVRGPAGDVADGDAQVVLNDPTGEVAPHDHGADPTQPPAPATRMAMPPLGSGLW